MSQLNLGLRPAMGYALWQLQHGTDRAAVALKMERDPRFAALSDVERNAAIEHAITNARITIAARQLTEQQQLGVAYGVPVSADTPLGARVLMTVREPNGNERQVSVVIGTRTGASIGDILTSAREFVLAGFLGQRTGRAYNVEIVGDPEIIQVVEGGYDNPALGVL